MARLQSPQDVELNITAMLDMAFQLLAFFILTYRPVTEDWGFGLHIPPARPVLASDGDEIGSQTVDLSKFKPASVGTLRVCVTSEGGGVDHLSVNDAPVTDLDDLRQTLSRAIADPAARFEQVVLEVSSRLRYEEVMKVVGVCSEQRLPMSGTLPKLSLTAIE